MADHVMAHQLSEGDQDLWHMDRRTSEFRSGNNQNNRGNNRQRVRRPQSANATHSAMLNRNRRNLAHLLTFAAEIDIMIPLQSLHAVHEVEEYQQHLCHQTVLGKKKRKRAWILAQSMQCHCVNSLEKTKKTGRWRILVQFAYAILKSESL